jgi:hypothetical protein
MVSPGPYQVQLLSNRLISVRGTTLVCLQSLEMLRVHCKLAAARLQLPALPSASSLQSWSEKTESLTGWKTGPSLVRPGSRICVLLVAGLLRTLFDFKVVSSTAPTPTSPPPSASQHQHHTTIPTTSHLPQQWKQRRTSYRILDPS